ncbi:hypothetical protein C0Q70_17143 [Pomacea canaliculata]|uniref:Uncharacterized protein n=1 Tax=Pomacea canaliculata TaxID=400727 RepID=A0A2T7NRR7_POMCA|nr:hypothetical protein C0Q70_17143 [Pomacea canaliculata]
MGQHSLTGQTRPGCQGRVGGSHQLYGQEHRPGWKARWVGTSPFLTGQTPPPGGPAGQGVEARGTGSRVPLGKNTARLRQVGLGRHQLYGQNTAWLQGWCGRTSFYTEQEHALAGRQGGGRHPAYQGQVGGAPALPLGKNPPWEGWVAQLSHWQEHRRVQGVGGMGRHQLPWARRPPWLDKAGGVVGTSFTTGPRTPPLAGAGGGLVTSVTMWKLYREHRPGRWGLATVYGHGPQEHRLAGRPPGFRPLARTPPWLEGRVGGRHQALTTGQEHRPGWSRVVGSRHSFTHWARKTPPGWKGAGWVGTSFNHWARTPPWSGRGWVVWVGTALPLYGQEITALAGRQGGWVAPALPLGKTPALAAAGWWVGTSFPTGKKEQPWLEGRVVGRHQLYHWARTPPWLEGSGGCGRHQLYHWAKEHRLAGRQGGWVGTSFTTGQNTALRKAWKARVGWRRHQLCGHSTMQGEWGRRPAYQERTPPWLEGRVVGRHSFTTGQEDTALAGRQGGGVHRHQLYHWQEHRPGWKAGWVGRHQLYHWARTPPWLEGRVGWSAPALPLGKNTALAGRQGGWVGTSFTTGQEHRPGWKAGDTPWVGLAPALPLGKNTALAGRQGGWVGTSFTTGQEHPPWLEGRWVGRHQLYGWASHRPGWKAGWVGSAPSLPLGKNTALAGSRGGGGTSFTTGQTPPWLKQGGWVGTSFTTGQEHAPLQGGVAPSFFTGKAAVVGTRHQLYHWARTPPWWKAGWVGSASQAAGGGWFAPLGKNTALAGSRVVGRTKHQALPLGKKHRPGLAEGRVGGSAPALPLAPDTAWLEAGWWVGTSFFHWARNTALARQGGWSAQLYWARTPPWLERQGGWVGTSFPLGKTPPWLEGRQWVGRHQLYHWAEHPPWLEGRVRWVGNQLYLSGQEHRLYPGLLGRQGGGSHQLLPLGKNTALGKRQVVGRHQLYGQEHALVEQHALAGRQGTPPWAGSRVGGSAPALLGRTRQAPQRTPPGWKATPALRQDTALLRRQGGWVGTSTGLAGEKGQGGWVGTSFKLGKNTALAGRQNTGWLWVGRHQLYHWARTPPWLEGRVGGSAPALPLGKNTALAGRQGGWVGTSFTTGQEHRPAEGRVGGSAPAYPLARTPPWLWKRVGGSAPAFTDWARTPPWLEGRVGGSAPALPLGKNTALAGRQGGWVGTSFTTGQESPPWLERQGGGRTALPLARTPPWLEGQGGWVGTKLPLGKNTALAGRQGGGSAPALHWQEHRPGWKCRGWVSAPPPGLEGQGGWVGTSFTTGQEHRPGWKAGGWVGTSFTTGQEHALAEAGWVGSAPALPLGKNTALAGSRVVGRHAALPLGKQHRTWLEDRVVGRHQLYHWARNTALGGSRAGSRPALTSAARTTAWLEGRVVVAPALPLARTPPLAGRQGGWVGTSFYHWQEHRPGWKAGWVGRHQALPLARTPPGWKAWNTAWLEGRVVGRQALPLGKTAPGWKQGGWVGTSFTTGQNTAWLEGRVGGRHSFLLGKNPPGKQVGGSANRLNMGKTPPSGWNGRVGGSPALPLARTPPGWKAGWVGRHQLYNGKRNACPGSRVEAGWVGTALPLARNRPAGRQGGWVGTLALPLGKNTALAGKAGWVVAPSLTTGKNTARLEGQGWVVAPALPLGEHRPGWKAGWVGRHQALHWAKEHRPGWKAGVVGSQLTLGKNTAHGLEGRVVVGTSFPGQRTLARWGRVGRVGGRQPAFHWQRTPPLAGTAGWVGRHQLYPLAPPPWLEAGWGLDHYPARTPPWLERQVGGSGNQAYNWARTRPGWRQGWVVPAQLLPLATKGGTTGKKPRPGWKAGWVGVGTTLPAGQETPPLAKQGWWVAQAFTNMGKPRPTGPWLRKAGWVVGTRFGAAGKNTAWLEGRVGGSGTSFSTGPEQTPPWAEGRVGWSHPALTNWAENTHWLEGPGWVVAPTLPLAKKPPWRKAGGNSLAGVQRGGWGSGTALPLGKKNTPCLAGKQVGGSAPALPLGKKPALARKAGGGSRHQPLPLGKNQKLGKNTLGKQGGCGPTTRQEHRPAGRQGGWVGIQPPLTCLARTPPCEGRRGWVAPALTTGQEHRPGLEGEGGGSTKLSHWARTPPWLEGRVGGRHRLPLDRKRPRWQSGGVQSFTTGQETPPWRWKEGGWSHQAFTMAETPPGWKARVVGNTTTGQETPPGWRQGGWVGHQLYHCARTPPWLSRATSFYHWARTPPWLEAGWGSATSFTNWEEHRPGWKAGWVGSAPTYHWARTPPGWKAGDGWVAQLYHWQRTPPAGLEGRVGGRQALHWALPNWATNTAWLEGRVGGSGIQPLPPLGKNIPPWLEGRVGGSATSFTLGKNNRPGWKAGWCGRHQAFTTGQEHRPGWKAGWVGRHQLYHWARTPPWLEGRVGGSAPALPLGKNTALAGRQGGWVGTSFTTGQDTAPGWKAGWGVGTSFTMARTPPLAGRQVGGSHHRFTLGRTPPWMEAGTALAGRQGGWVGTALPWAEHRPVLEGRWVGRAPAFHWARTTALVLEGIGVGGVGTSLHLADTALEGKGGGRHQLLPNWKNTALAEAGWWVEPALPLGQNRRWLEGRVGWVGTSFTTGKKRLAGRAGWVGRHGTSYHGQGNALLEGRWVGRHKFTQLGKNKRTGLLKGGWVGRHQF